MKCYLKTENDCLKTQTKHPQLSSHPHRLVESELFYINNLLLIAPRGKFNGS